MFPSPYADILAESGLDCVYQGNYRERESSRSAKYDISFDRVDVSKVAAINM